MTKRRNAKFSRPQPALRLVPAVLAVAMLVLVPVSGVASAGVAKPKIATFTASPSAVTTSNGTVVLSGTVANATNCTLSSSVPVGGLPVTADCSSGSVTQTVVVLINSGTKKSKYKISLIASGPGGSKTKKISLSVAPGAGQAMPTGFTGTYVGSDDSGDDTNGSFTFSGTADPNFGCDQSACAFDWTAVNGGWSWADPNGCTQWTADDNSGIGDASITGVGIIESDPTSPTGYSAYFYFGVWSFDCGSPPASNQFLSHMTGIGEGFSSGDPSFAPGAAQSVWASLGGGTFTFSWAY